MNETQNDIRLIIRIRNTQNLIDPKLLIQVLDLIENALYESDKNDIELFFRQYELRNIDPIIRDAILNRIREYRHNRLIIDTAYSGSFVIETLVSGAAILVVKSVLDIFKSTIGKSLEKGYENSIMNEQISLFFKNQIDSKYLFIVDKLKRIFKTKKKMYLSIKSEPQKLNQAKHIIIDITDDTDNKDKNLKTLGEALNS
jgi:hypothetical protein